MTQTDSFGADARPGTEPFAVARADLLSLSDESRCGPVPAIQHRASNAGASSDRPSEGGLEPPAQVGSFGCPPSEPPSPDAPERRAGEPRPAAAAIRQLASQQGVVGSGEPPAGAPPELDMTWLGTDLSLSKAVEAFFYGDSDEWDEVDFVGCRDLSETYTFVCSMCRTHRPGKMPTSGPGSAGESFEWFCSAECRESYKDRHRGWMPR